MPPAWTSPGTRRAVAPCTLASVARSAASCAMAAALAAALLAGQPGRGLAEEAREGTVPPATEAATAAAPAEPPAVAEAPAVASPPAAAAAEAPPIAVAPSAAPPAETASAGAPPVAAPPSEDPRAEAAPAEAPPAEVPQPAAPSAAPEAGAEVVQPSSASPTTTLAPPSRDPHEKPATNAPSLLTTRIAPGKKVWEDALGGFVPSRFAIARRLVDRPARLLVDPSTLPDSRDAFLWRVARDTWNGLESLTDRDSGLVVDNVRVVGGLVPPLALRVGDYTNITNIGLQLVALAAARAIGLVEDTDARASATRILDTLADLERHDGYFFNYYDTTSLEPTSTFVSFVDTGWLVAGLMVTRQAFPHLAATVDDLLDPIDFRFFYDPSSRLMSHGYYANLRSLSAYEYGAFYTEARLGSLIAIGKGDAPVEHWYAMKRALEPGCVDGDCPVLHRMRYETADGRPMTVAHYRWRGTEYVPSWGGSMFEALMPGLVLDEERWAPRSLGPNGRAHALLQKTYATEVLGFPVWGMSPCTTPSTGLYGEFGVRALGNHGYAETVVTPHAAALALAVAPDDAAANLMEIARRYPIYGPYGFYDAVEPATGRVAYDLLALDQLMLFLAVANHLSRGEVYNHFAADPWVRPALSLLAEERFFE